MARIVGPACRGPDVFVRVLPPEGRRHAAHARAHDRRARAARPTFVSVTYGAGGSTRERTHDSSPGCAKETAITPMAHLTCQGHVRAEIDEILAATARGIENILALGGDPPADAAEQPERLHATPPSWSTTSSRPGDFSIGVAAHRRRTPGHPIARPTAATSPTSSPPPTSPSPSSSSRPSTTSPRRRARRARRRQAGDPGIMPITNIKQIAGWPSSGRRVPAWVVDTVSGSTIRTSPPVGVEIASTLCAAAGGRCARSALLHDEPLDGDS